MQICVRILSFLLLSRFIPSTLSQTLTNLPQCWQNCISDSGHFNCAALDVSCVCRAWNGGVLVSTLACIKSTCDSSLDADLLLSPLELTCDLAGVPISSAIISSALQAATTAVVTNHVTVTTTLTQSSYYWQSSFATIATTIVVPITESNNGPTLIVAFPVTIEPSTTIYGSPSTSSPPAPQSTTQSTTNCDDPGIIYYTNDGLFAPSNQTQFPYGASPDIASVESFICKRLRHTSCHASAEAQRACNDAFDAYSGLAGQNAADVWNIALGLLPATTPVETVTVTASFVSGQPTATLWSTTSTSTSTWNFALTTTTVTVSSSGEGWGSDTSTSTSTWTWTSTATATVTGGSSGSSDSGDGGGSPFDPQGSATSVRPRELGLLLMILFLTLVLFL